MVLNTGRKDDAGLVAVLTAVVVVAVVMPLLAVVVDLGASRTANARARAAADAAALTAAVQRRKGTDLETAARLARQVADANLDVSEAQWAGCVDPQHLATTAGPGTCVSFDARQVRVRIPPRPVASVFAGVLGATPPQASAVSAAAWGGRPRVARLVPAS